MVVVHDAGELHALFHEPVDVAARAVHEVEPQIASAGPLRGLQLAPDDLGGVDLDALLHFQAGAHGEDAFDADAVASGGVHLLDADDLGAVAGGLHGGGQARHAQAHHQHVGVERLLDVGGRHVLVGLLLLVFLGGGIVVGLRRAAGEPGAGGQAAGGRHAEKRAAGKRRESALARSAGLLGPVLFGGLG